MFAEVAAKLAYKDGLDAFKYQALINPALIVLSTDPDLYLWLD